CQVVLLGLPTHRHGTGSRDGMHAAVSAGACLLGFLGLVGSGESTWIRRGANAISRRRVRLPHARLELRLSHGKPVLPLVVWAKVQAVAAGVLGFPVRGRDGSVLVVSRAR